MNAIARFFRRRLYAHRVAKWQHEVAHLEQLRLKIAPALDHALRQLGHARTDLVFLDIYRPLIAHAKGEHRRDGGRRMITADIDAQREKQFGVKNA